MRTQKSLQRGVKTHFYYLRKILRKFLNKLGTPQILSNHVHLISIIPIFRNNSQAYIPHIDSLLKHC
jgi:hypothetical protein